MFKIAGKDFYEYVAYRLKKDKLGFIPSGRWNEGSTDRVTFIKSVVPNSAYDFLVYAHELGHCKSEQFASNSCAFFSGGVDYNRLRSEFNAWVWAIRYIRKLKIEVTKQEWVDALNKSFKSYTREYSGARTSNDFIEKLNNMLGISLEMESERVNVTTSYPFISANSVMRFPTAREILGDWEPFVPVKKTTTEKAKPVTINKKHKPWMDMLDNQRKKHQRYAKKFA
jgi:hypothetical protein